MGRKLLIACIATVLMIPTAALAAESEVDTVSDRVSDQAEQVDRVETDRATDHETDTETDRPRDHVTDEPDITRRCLEADKVTDRCCARFADDNPTRCRDFLCRDTDVLTDRCCVYFADEYPERCRDHTCADLDVLTDRCCVHLADDHPERCRDREVDEPHYRALFWRLFEAGEWQLIIRLLNHLSII